MFARQPLVMVFFMLITIFGSFGKSIASEPAPEGICHVDGPMSETAFHEFVDCTSRTLRDIIWPKNIIPGIRIAGVQMLANDAVALLFPKDCSFKPSYKPGTNKLVFSYPLQYYSLYNQQAILAYLMGMPFAPTPEALQTFLEKELRPHLVASRTRCPGSQLQRTGKVVPFPPSIMSRKISRAEQEELIRIAKYNMLIRKLEAYIAFSSTFFTLIHEYGHAVLHNNDRENSLAFEVEADNYAATVMEANDLPVIISLGLFDLLHGAAHSSHSKGLACRLRQLSQGHPIPTSFKQEFGEQISMRLSDLRNFYITFYNHRCTTK